MQCRLWIAQASVSAYYLTCKQLRAMKRPGALVRPAAVSERSKKAKTQEKQEEPLEEDKEEQELQDQESEEEEPKEEDKEEQPEKVPAQKLTKKALQNHEEFLKQAGEKKLSTAEFEAALQKLPEKQQQCLWKRFEGSRKAARTDEEYKKETSGVGAMARKKKLLMSWCLDGGKVSERYRTALAAISLEKQHGVEKEWLSKKRMEDELGTEEMKQRLQAGTLRYRRNPEDGRFFQFQKLSEKEATLVKKQKTSKTEATGSASAKDLVSFDSLMLEEVNEDDFVLGAAHEDEVSETEGIDKELAKAMGIKNTAEEKEKKEKAKDKWAALSEVGKNEKQGEIEEKLVKFKTEIAKDMAALEAGAWSLQKQGGDKALLKNVLSAKKKASDSLSELTKLLEKKSAKRELVVPALTKALACLKEGKALKAQLNKALKA